MFKAGDKWLVTRTDGNTGNGVLAPNNIVDQPRTISEVRTEDFISINPNGHPVYTSWPKASEIIEARDGLLHWSYGGAVEVKFRRLIESAGSIG